MKYTLQKCYRWKVLASTGVLESLPEDSYDILTRIFSTKEAAIGCYAELINEASAAGTTKGVPSSLILIEEHYIGYDWND